MMNKYFILRKIVLVILGLILGFYSGISYYQEHSLDESASIHKLEKKVQKEKHKSTQLTKQIQEINKKLQKYNFTIIDNISKTNIKRFFSALCEFETKNQIANCTNVNILSDFKYLNVIDINIYYKNEIEAKKGAAVIDYVIKKYFKPNQLKFYSKELNLNTYTVKYFKPMKQYNKGKK